MKIIISGKTSINLDYLKSLAIDNTIYSKTLIIRGQASSHEEARDLFVQSGLGEVVATKKGFKLVLPCN